MRSSYLLLVTNIRYQDEFESEVARCNGNRYEAINTLCGKSRKLSESVNNAVRQIDSIHWALSGVPPASLATKTHAVSEYEKLMEEYLCQVEDQGVASSVRTSFSQSVNIGHLVYVYQDDLNAYKEARVRIITNMLWYLLLKERKKN